MANNEQTYTSEVMEQKKALGIHCPAISGYEVVADPMTLFYCSARYTPKGCQKARGYTGYVIAANEAEAIAKFKQALPASLEQMPRREYSVHYNAIDIPSGVSYQAIAR